jgi:hypothetical protein
MSARTHNPRAGPTRFLGRQTAALVGSANQVVSS